MNKNDEELLDIVDKNDHIIGKMTRKEAHANPNVIHRGTAVLLYNSKSQTLLAQRSKKLDHEPGKWTIASSGHVKRGEDPIEACKRELKEELGIETDLKFYKKVFKQYETESMIYYVCYSLIDNLAIDINKEEVQETKWVMIDHLKNFAQNHYYSDSDIANKITLEIAKKLHLI